MLNRRRVLMHPRGWELPKEYAYVQFVRTVENDMIWIDTGVGGAHFDPRTVDIEIKFSSSGGTNTVSAAIFGFRTSAQQNQFALFDSGASVALSNRYGTTGTNFFTAAKGYVKGNTYTYKATTIGNYRTVYIDGAEMYKVSTHPTRLGNIYLFGCNENDSGSVSNVNGIRTIYYCKIWNTGTLVRDFIPVRRIADGKVGLFDKITNKFYISPNGHNFVSNYVDETGKQHEFESGDYMNPITYVSGMTVEYGKWYSNGSDIWEAIKNGVPADFNDHEYFDIIDF